MTARDTLLPGVLVLLALVSAPFVDVISDVDRDLDALGVALLVTVASTTVLRRRWPLATLALVAAGTSGYLALAYPYGPVMFSLAVAVYAVARAVRLLPAALAALGTLALLSAHLLTNPAALAGAAGLLPALAWVAIPFTLGLARRLVAEAGARERAESDRRLVDAERLRLAQEVHDVVGHGLAAIQMQADIALHLRRTATRAGRARRSRRSAGPAPRRSTSCAPPSPRSLRAARGRRVARPDSRAGAARRPGRPGRATRAWPSTLAVTGATATAAAARSTWPPTGCVQESLTNVVKHSAHPHASCESGTGRRRDDFEVANQDLGLPSRRAADGHRHRRHAPPGRRARRPAHGRPGSRRRHFEVRATIPLGVDMGATP